MKDTKKVKRTTKYGHRVVYISIPKETYTRLEDASSRNCRTIGRELLFAWQESQARKV